MQYSELSYFLFLPLVMLLYTFTPKKFRYITLLVASLFFFYTLSGKLLIYVVYSTLIMYFASLLIDHFNELEDNINDEMPKEEKKKPARRRTSKKAVAEETPVATEETITVEEVKEDKPKKRPNRGASKRKTTKKKVENEE